MLTLKNHRIGPFITEKKLGEGGSAEVWQVRHDLLGARFALKLPRTLSDSSRALLMREGLAQQQLNHPNLLPIRHVLQHNDRIGLVMMLVRGPSLGAVMRTHRLPERSSIGLLRALCTGLAFAHSRGFVHRDLKPDNVLLDAQPGQILPRIADFGLGRFDGQELPGLRSGLVYGTPGYAAPEQYWDVTAVDHRADLFSLGVILVELLTGQRPYPSGWKKPGQQPALGELGGELRALARALLSHAPEDRPPDADAVLSMLPEVPGALGPGSELMAAVRDFSRASSVRLVTDMSPATATATVTAGADSVPGAVSPGNLPSLPGRFFGRAAEWEALGTKLRAGEPLISLHGPGGAGKTRLALELGRGLHRAGGVWLCPLSGAAWEGAVMSRIRTALGVASPGASRTQMAWSLRKLGAVVLILDSCDQGLEAAAALLAEVQQVAAGLQVITTSRPPLPGAPSIALGPLPEADALEMFTDIAGPLTETQRSVVLPALLDELERLPLIIALVAGWGRRLSPETLRERMADHGRLLHGLQAQPESRHRTLWKTLEWSWRMLSPVEQQALAQCSIFEGSFDLSAASAVLVLSDGSWPETALASLASKSLLQVTPAEGSTLMATSQSVRAFARSQWEPIGLNTAALRSRYSAFYADRAQRLISAGAAQASLGLQADLPDYAAAARQGLAIGELASAVHCARAALEVYVSSGPFEAGIDLARTLSTAPGLTPEEQLDLLLIQARLGFNGGHSAAVQPLITRCIALASAREDSGRKIKALLLEGSLLRELGELSESLERFQQALQLARQIDDRPSQIRALWRYGGLLRRFGRTDEGITALREGIALSQQIGDPILEASTRRALGTQLRIVGRLDDAQVELEAAVRLARAHGAGQTLSSALKALGSLQHVQGDDIAALESLQDSEAVACRIGDVTLLPYILNTMGIIHYHAAGNADAARRCYEEALEMARAFGELLSELNVLQNYGFLLLSSEPPSEALACFERGTALAERYGDQMLHSRFQSFQAQVLWRCGRLDEAAARLTRIIDTFGEHKNPRWQMLTRITLGVVLSGQGRHREARSMLTQCLDFFEHNGMKTNALSTRGDLGFTCLVSGDLDEAERHLRAVLREVELQGQTKLRQVTLLRLGRLHGARGQLHEARTTLKAVLQLAEQQKDPLPILMVVTELGHIAALEGEQAEAQRHLMRAEEEAAQAHLPPQAPNRQRLHELREALTAQ